LLLLQRGLGPPPKSVFTTEITEVRERKRTMNLGSSLRMT
jgi:hypothetical protein